MKVDPTFFQNDGHQNMLNQSTSAFSVLHHGLAPSRPYGQASGNSLSGFSVRGATGGTGAGAVLGCGATGMLGTVCASPVPFICFCISLDPSHV